MPLVASLLVIVILTAQTAWAQSTAGSQPTVDTRLEQIPLEVEALGMSIHPPAGSNVAAQRVEGNLSISINEPLANPRWSLTIQILNSTLDIPTAEGQIEDHLNALKNRNTPFTLIKNERIILDNQPGQLCFIQQSTASGQNYITGWLIVPAGIRSFLVVSLLAMPDSFEDFRPTLEASFQTIKITSQEELSLRIRSEIDTGKRLLSSLTPEQLQAIAKQAQPQWRRVYMPSKGSEPEKEIAYMYVDTFPGNRTLFNTERHILNYDEAEREEGLVVQVYVRVLEGKDIRDVEMVYWMSWNQDEESFSVRGTRRQGQASVSESVTGIRAEQPVPTYKQVDDSTGSQITSGEISDRVEPILTVVTASSNTRARDPSSWVVPESYLSQALNWILPAAMPRDREQYTYGYYFFDMAMAQPTLQRRVDTWGPADSAAGASSRWQLTTHVGDSDQPLVTIYANDGTFIKRVHPDGAVTEPIDLLALKRLWQGKGLPISADDVKSNRRK